MKTYTCYICKFAKDESFFYKAKGKVVNQCKGCCKKRIQDYRINNREKYRQSCKEQRLKNLQHHKMRRRKYYRLQKETSNTFNVDKCMRNILRDICKYDVKYRTSMKLLGYTIEEFRNHIQRKFKQGMKWSNYGGMNGWCLDHIIPRYLFKNRGDINSSDFKKCWSLSNLQPLWWRENVLKGKKYILI